MACTCRTHSVSLTLTFRKIEGVSPRKWTLVSTTTHWKASEKAGLNGLDVPKPLRPANNTCRSKTACKAYWIFYRNLAALLIETSDKWETRPHPPVARRGDFPRRRDRSGFKTIVKNCGRRGGTCHGSKQQQLNQP